MTQPHDKAEVLKYAMAFELGAEIDEIEGDSETAEAHRVTAAMLRAYAEVVEGWRPIETAPKDGREIIVGAENSGSWIAYWPSEPNYYDETGWQEADGREGLWYTRHPGHPTHWQPIPEFPPLTAALSTRNGK